MRETEVKIEVESADRARALLGRIGAAAKTPRYFEDNRVYDDASRTLFGAGRLLRLRDAGSRHVVTFKKPIEGAAAASDYKVRAEEECRVDDPQAFAAILEGLGFAQVYRYQKYRQRYRLGTLHVELDETPIGTFLELEGDPADIDAAALKLGFDRSSYIVTSYRELHVERSGKDDPGDLLFPDEPATRASR